MAFAVVAGLVAVGTWGGMSIPATPPPDAPPSGKGGIDLERGERFVRVRDALLSAR